MISPAAIAGALLAVAVLLWPRRDQVEAAAAGSIINAARDDAEGIVRWWNRDVKWSHLLPSRRSGSVPVGFLDGMAAALGAGLTPAESVRVAAHERTDGHLSRANPGWLDPVLDSAHAGRPIGSVWQSVARRSGDPDIAALGRAWVISERLGAPLADAVAGAAEMSRARTALEAAITSATAGAKVTSTLLTVLPVGGVGLAAILGIHPLTLYSHPLALISLTIGLALLLLGRWWVGRMIRAVSVPT